MRHLERFRKTPAEIINALEATLQAEKTI